MRGGPIISCVFIISKDLTTLWWYFIDEKSNVNFESSSMQATLLLFEGGKVSMTTSSYTKILYQLGEILGEGDTRFPLLSIIASSRPKIPSKVVELLGEGSKKNNKKGKRNSFSHASKRISWNFLTIYANKTLIMIKNIFGKTFSMSRGSKH